MGRLSRDSGVSKQIMIIEFDTAVQEVVISENAMSLCEVKTDLRTYLRGVLMFCILWLNRLQTQFIACEAVQIFWRSSCDDKQPPAGIYIYGSWRIPGWYAKWENSPIWSSWEYLG